MIGVLIVCYVERVGKLRQLKNLYILERQKKQQLHKPPKFVLEKQKHLNCLYIKAVVPPHFGQLKKLYLEYQSWYPTVALA